MTRINDNEVHQHIRGSFFSGSRNEPTDGVAIPRMAIRERHRARWCYYKLKRFMAYQIKEIYYTLQGEGAQSGRAAVFCRFAGCNLWTGHEADRGTAVCQFCDTDFVGTDGPGGGEFASPAELAGVISRTWNAAATDSAGARRLVVCTGGEPLLQLDAALVDELRQAGFEIAIETNGTLAAPAGIDWVCVSPKAGAALRIVAGDELKLIYPQPGAPP